MVLHWSLGTIFRWRYEDSKFKLHFRDGVPVSSSIGTDSATTENAMMQLLKTYKKLFHGT
jgi:hypothetical protein